MTINRSQSQTLRAVGLYLPRPVFAHGHLYVAMSRVGREDRFKAFIDHDKPEFENKEENDTTDTYTENIVYTAVLQSNKH